MVNLRTYGLDFTGVNEEKIELFLPIGKFKGKRVTMKSIAFSHQTFDSVSFVRQFRYPLWHYNAKTQHRQYIAGFAFQIKHTKRVFIQPFTGFEKVIEGGFASEYFRFRELIHRMA